MLNPSLFPIEMNSTQIAAPEICFSPKELIHNITQVDGSLKVEHKQECFLIYRRAKQKRKPYFVQFVVWPDGNWACMYDEHFRDWEIAVGQYKTAYFSSSDESKHFYHLEANTTSDLILRV